MSWIKLLIVASLIFLLQSSVSAGRLMLQVADVYTVKPDILALRIDVGKTIYGKQIPYRRFLGDRIDRGKEDAWVNRGGQAIGTLVGKKQNILYTLDRYVSRPLDVNWAMQPNSYRITSTSDRNYKSSTLPQTVFRKSKPTDMARVGQWKFEWPVSHVLYLKLPTALQPGSTYQINFNGTHINNLRFKYEPEAIKSEAVHVSHIGFRADDPAKVAFLSTWMGNGGGLDYSEGLPFWVINEKNNQKVYQGTTKLSKKKNENEDPRRNHTLTDVYMMDFSNFKQVGDYRVCVDLIGCSFPFKIGQDTWKDAFKVSARGFYHQRSGIKLSPPYTTFNRPRPFHPDDGVNVYQSSTPLMNTDMGIGKEKTFEALVKNKTKRQLKNAWGGYFDAGDWDRRIQHLEVSRLLLELNELFPNYFKNVSLNIPESKNSLPDTLDEALWAINFFKRLQTPDGGIRGGIESAEHPRFGETSWQESFDVMAYAPDKWSSYMYAGVAARAAYVLRSQYPKLATQYRQSALKAMAYAEREYSKSQAQKIPFQVRDNRNLAAVELYRLTGDSRWHDIFLKTTVYTDPKKEMFEWEKHDQRDAAFVYARLTQVKPEIQKNALNALLREADTSLTFGSKTGFKWTKTNPHEPVCWGSSFGSPKTVTLLRAHAIAQNPKYLQATVLASQFSGGANPENMTYTTGLGHRSPQHPLIIDQRVTGQAPPPGITVYGPLDLWQFSDFWTVPLFQAATFPNPWQWPTTEGYFDIYLYPAVTEFTIQQTMAPTAYTWGYLAARNST